MKNGEKHSTSMGPLEIQEVINVTAVYSIDHMMNLVSKFQGQAILQFCTHTSNGYLSKQVLMEVSATCHWLRATNI